MPGPPPPPPPPSRAEGSKVLSFFPPLPLFEQWKADESPFWFPGRIRGMLSSSSPSPFLRMKKGSMNRGGAPSLLFFFFFFPPPRARNKRETVFSLLPLRIVANPGQSGPSPSLAAKKDKALASPPFLPRPTNTWVVIHVPIQERWRAGRTFSLHCLRGRSNEAASFLSFRTRREISFLLSFFFFLYISFGARQEMMVAVIRVLLLFPRGGRISTSRHRLFPIVINKHGVRSFLSF